MVLVEDLAAHSYSVVQSLFWFWNERTNHKRVQISDHISKPAKSLECVSGHAQCGSTRTWKDKYGKHQTLVCRARVGTSGASKESYRGISEANVGAGAGGVRGRRAGSLSIPMPVSATRYRN
ncbi:hypothetical protein EVAR_92885_1 [Eumeta japonica]|uniref:Uncharacterized protein n=1 Tax=Eumeta variegata TaxID=151549 RepID=A0A4C1TB59_EUMVA|nr:hypothetical protein EVAR_92885_1 [Eumeta japonica]